MPLAQVSQESEFRIMDMSGAIGRLRDVVLLSHGARRYLTALLAGAVAALAMPPLFLFPLLALSFALLLWLIDGIAEAAAARRYRIAFLVGWTFGFGYFLAGLWWVGAAFLVESDVFGWLLPIAVAGLPALLALFTGCGVVTARLMWSASPARACALAAGIGLSEYVRGIAFTGFPWNAFGYALTGTGAQMQAASLIGVDGLTVLAIFISLAPAMWFARDRELSRLRNLIVAGAVALLFGQLVFGEIRLLLADATPLPGVRLRLVQPNLTQAERLDRNQHIDILERYLRLSRPNPDQPAPTHVIWPESALPFRLGDSPQALTRITGMLAPDAVLILGMLRGDDLDQRRVLNSLFVLDDKARIRDRYDKVHLVPFGEYLPFSDVLSFIGLEPLTRIFAFVPGQQRGPVAGGKAPPFAAMICYEAIFPGEVAQEGRAGWLVNISDDSWFGDTPGPRQHFHQARLRAVEQGLSLARVTTTGRSALFDPYGRIVASLEIGREGVIDAGLPGAIEPPPYAWLRGSGFWCIWTIFAAFASITRISLIFSRNNF